METAKPTGLARAGIVVAAVLAVMIQAIDATIAAVALPHMQGSLSASVEEISWVITSYVVAVAIMTAPTAWLANRFGRKQVLFVAMTGFTVTSVLAGFAQTLDQIVLLRFFQGAFGAPLVPLTQSLLLDTFEPEESVRALSWWSLGTIIGPVIGPNLGGWLTEHWDWRWVFFINLPIGLVALILLSIYVSETQSKKIDFDWLGFAALSVFIGSFQLVMDRGSIKDWYGSTEIIVESILAFVGLYVFVVHSFFKPDPLGILRDRNFFCGLVFTFVNSFLLITVVVLVPAFLQKVAGYTVEQSGVLMTPRALGGGLALLLSGRVMRVMDPRVAAFLGLLLLIYGMYLMSFWTADVSGMEVVVTGFFQGFGTTLAFVPMQTLMFSGVAASQRNAATTAFGLARNVSQSTGVSLVTVILVRSIQTNHEQLATHATPFNHALQTGAAQLFWNPAFEAGRASLDAEVNRQAELIAYCNDFRVMMYGAILCLPLVFLLRLPTAAKARSGGAPVTAPATE